MKLKPVIHILAIAAAMASCSGSIPVVDCPKDMALIYYGSCRRPDMDKSDMAKYLFRTAGDGSVEWLFDGLLFLEINAEDGERKYDYGIPHDEYAPARKREWEWLMEKNFSAGHAFDAAEQVLDSLDDAGVKIPYRRQIVIALPNPHHDAADWGEIGGRKLDMTDTDDRFAALKWYIDENLKKWDMTGYRYLNLGGFYWLHEQLDMEYGDDVLVDRVIQYLKGLGYPLVWIPWNGAPGADRWKETGFGTAYQQPNYFFYDYMDSTAVTDALKFARQHGLYMEMEFDGRVNEKKFADKFYTYLRLFRKAGVWDNVPVAYYDGGGAWLDLVNASDPQRREMCRALGDILAARKTEY